jgi:hypothetical protein
MRPLTMASGTARADRKLKHRSVLNYDGEMRATSFLGLLCILAMSCGSDNGGALGATCSQSGATTGQCAAGGVCGAHSDGDSIPRCLTVCTQQSDCASNEDCNGVEGSSLKGCRLKSTTTTGSSGSGGKK